MFRGLIAGCFGNDQNEKTSRKVRRSFPVVLMLEKKLSSKKFIHRLNPVSYV